MKYAMTLKKSYWKKEGLQNFYIEIKKVQKKRKVGLKKGKR